MDFIIGFVLATLLLMVLIKYFIWLIKYIKLVLIINKIPTTLKWLPFIGNAHQFRLGSEFTEQLKEELTKLKNEKLFRIWIGINPVIIFSKAESIEFLVNSSKHIDKSFNYDSLYPWLGTGLLTSTGDKWHQRRRLLTPSFHFEILNDFLLVMNEQADIFISNLKREQKKNHTFDLCPFISNCSLDIICETAMGYNLEAQQNKNSEYVKAVVRVSELIFLQMIYPWYANRFIFSFSKFGKEYDKTLKFIKDFTKQIILDRSVEFDEVGKFDTRKHIAFLDTLLKYKQEDLSITFDDIQEEVDTFMFEGHDTTASATSWACYLIGSYPKVQEKLHQEIDEIFGDSERHLTNDDLHRLKYVECVIKETLRLFPPVAMFGRTVTEDCKCDEYKIPKGTTALIFAQVIHQDERYFENPKDFIPERFFPENMKNKHPYCYIPFSAGKRNCIGQKFAMMEEKVLLTNILRKFKIKSLQKCVEETQPDFEIILRPKKGILVQLELRELQ